jgi:hypothetical protein
VSPAPVKRFRLLDFARIDGEVQGPGHVFSRSAGDVMPERVSVQTSERVGPSDGFELKLKCSPLFEEIDDHIEKSSVPLMTAMPFAGQTCSAGSRPESMQRSAPDAFTRART